VSTTSPAPSTRRSFNVKTLVAAGVGIAVVAGAVSGVIVHFSADNSSNQTGSNATRCPAIKIADSVLPSVVTLSVQSGSSGSSGSGEVIRNSGYILTNDHVISSGARGGTVDALFSSGQTYRATVVGRSTELDLAVVKVSAPDKLPTITFGDSNSLRVGQPVVALGAPLGLDGSVTSGIVSALGRDVSVPAEGGQTARLVGAVQTDASINPGNSGGALVDCSGHLVGVNTAIATVPDANGGASSGSVGIGFAIPVDLATVVADQLIDNGTFTPLYTGMSTLPIPASVAHSFGVTDGLYVRSLTSGGPAAVAGIQQGDVITKIDRQAATTPDSLVLATLTKKDGDKLSIDYLRDGKAGSTSLTLTKQP
jgi:putative serine protease PepD